MDSISVNYVIKTQIFVQEINTHDIEIQFENNFITLTDFEDLQWPCQRPTKLNRLYILKERTAFNYLFFLAALLASASAIC